MAHELVACCNGRADLLVLPARSHNEPFYNPQPHYWGPIISWLLQEDASQQMNEPLTRAAD